MRKVTSANKRETEPARFLLIEGCHNLRDMGGYQTDDGRVVKWRQLYRSGEFAVLSDSARTKIAHLDIVAICDFRCNDERTSRPGTWDQGFKVDYWSRDYDLSAGKLFSLAGNGVPSQAAMTSRIQKTYRRLPYEQADAYRELFRRLSMGKIPLLFNCTAGKDRTGVAAALVLWALGVSYGTIVEDYALTDCVLEDLVLKLFSDPKYAVLATLPRTSYLPLLQSSPSYIETMFDEVVERHGSVQGYMSEILGVGDIEVAAMRTWLLED